MHIQIVTHFLKKYKALLLYIAVFLWFFLLSGESLFAAEEPVLSKEDSEKVVAILNGIITWAAALMWMVTSFITMFLYPGWTNGTLFGLQDYLKTIWILISNIVYFIFAFILIAIAFMNIIGKGEWTWELKQAMPKFIVWVLIVPFSWFFVQFILSISAILTVWVLTLPYDSFGNKDLFIKAIENQEFWGKKICKDVIISFNRDFWDEDTSQLWEDSNELDENIKCRWEWDTGKITIKELMTGLDEWGNPSADAKGLQNSIFWVISIYSYGILAIDELDTINESQLQTVTSIADLIFKIVFDVLFIVVYLLLMIALLLALFVRWVRLWIYMMLSPAFGLLYFFWKWSEWVWESGDKFNIKEFIALALVPVYVSAALAFWLVFIMVAAEWIKVKAGDEPDTLKAWGFSLTLIGAHGEKSDDGTQDGTIIGKLIVEIFWVVILWIAVMSALWASKTTKAIVEPIAQFWKSVWELAAKAPTYAPIIPTGNWKSMWVAGLQTFGSNIAWWIDQQAKQRGTEFAQWFTNPSENERWYQNLANKAVTSSANSADTIRDILWTWAITELANSNSGLQWLVKHLEWVNTWDSATHWFRSQEQANNWIDQLWNSKWNIGNVREALMELDKLATIQENSILWWEVRVNSIWEVDRYVWTLVNDAQQTASTGVPEQSTPTTPWTTNINFTNINSWNAKDRAEAMPSWVLITEATLRERLANEWVPEEQHNWIVTWFQEANRIEESSDSDTN